MTRPPPLYPRGRLNAIVVSIALMAITLAGLVVVVVLQSATIAQADAHRHRDLKAVTAQLDRATAEIERLQALVRALGGNPGTFTLTPKPTPRPAASASHSAYVAPQPESSAPRATPTRHPSARPSPSQSPSRSPSPSPSRCVLPPPSPCIPPPVHAGFFMRVATLSWLRAVLRSAEERLSAAARRSP